MDKEELNKKIKLSEDIKSMQNSNGWEAVKQWVQAEITSSTNNVFNNKDYIGDPAKIAYQQGRVNFGTQLLRYLEVKKQMGDDAQKELSENEES
jgi:hypothetical protein